MAHVYNPSTGEVEAEGFQVQGQLELHIETLPHKTKVRDVVHW
jgi:hypothetical protein